MRYVTIFILFAIAFFASPSASEACMDASIKSIGTAKTKIRFNNWKRQIGICFQVTIKPGVKAPSFVGFRFPKLFSSVSKMPSKEINIVPHSFIKLIVRGKIRAFQYKRNKKYCLTLEAKKGYWENGYWDKQISRYVDKKRWRSPRDIYKKLKKNLKKEHNLKLTLKNLTRKIGRKGATLGSEFMSGSSGAKGGCGTNPINWEKLHPPKAIKVSPQDF